jgi:hypothetical protein
MMLLKQIGKAVRDKHLEQLKFQRLLGKPLQLRLIQILAHIEILQRDHES